MIEILTTLRFAAANATLTLQASTWSQYQAWSRAWSTADAPRIKLMFLTVFFPSQHDETLMGHLK